MSQHAEAISEQRAFRYSRVDFTAQRAYLSRIETATILRLYYNEDDLEDREIEGVAGLGRFLEHMRDDLIGRLIDSNPHVAESMQRARQSAVWPKAAIEYLINAVDATVSQPLPKDPVTRWFLPVASRRLKEDGIDTLEQLIDTIRARGKGWYRPIPCLGRLKAETIVRWLRKHEESLGSLPAVLLDLEHETTHGIVTIDRFSPIFAPLEQLRVVSAIDGSLGDNRHHLFPLISARNDYDAVQAFLYKFRGRDKTHKAYRKELERFLLWCIGERGKAMSSVMVDDCEAYKDFLAALPSRWVGVRKKRHSAEWRPFAGPLSAESQRYAIQVLRAFFSYLTAVRYLAANPWVAVSDPVVEKQLYEMQIDKALPADLWNKLSDPGGIIDQLCDLPGTDLLERYRLKGFAARQNVTAQLRLVRALVLLIGNTGMRREEIAFACRRNLTPHPSEPSLWQLLVLGKGKKWRKVYPTDREIDALKVHWLDRGEDFSFGMTDLPLVSPIIIPPTGNALHKHEGKSESAGAKGFSPDGIYTAVTSWLKRIADDELLDLSEHERQVLRTSGIHAFRHTFGTQAVADGMPLDVVQKILGHESLNTTTIYVQSEDKRAAGEVGKWMAKRRQKTAI